MRGPEEGLIAAVLVRSKDKKAKGKKKIAVKKNAVTSRTPIQKLKK
jgi:hypothetical protein